MDPVTIIQAVMAVATFVGAEVPKLQELAAVLGSGDQATLDAFLSKLQAENDKLGQA